MVLNEVFSVCAGVHTHTCMNSGSGVCKCTVREESFRHDVHRLAFKCLLKVMVHGVNIHVGHPFHGDVVLAMLEL